MLKKAVLLVVVTMLIAFGAGISYANQIGGMSSATGPWLPNDGTFAAPLAVNTAIQASVNPGGDGDTLVYPYYNVRGSMLNLFNVVNTHFSDGVKVRVVFRNGKNSREVLDFTICLSNGDVWTGYLLDDGTQGRLFSFDTDTVTNPVIGVAGEPFKSGSFPAPPGPAHVVTADDTREGYFEIYSMHTIPGYHKASCPAAGSVNCPMTPAQCDPIAFPVATTDAPNFLFGNNAIISLNNLETYSYNATAIADWTLFPFLVFPGFEPNLAFGDDGCNIEYMLTNAYVMTSYDLMASLGGETELIINFPTRLACHDNLVLPNIFDLTLSPTVRTYSTAFGVTLWDARENTTTAGFSPNPAIVLPNEVNVLKFGGSGIFTSTLGVSIGVGSFDYGWAFFDMDPNGNHWTQLGVLAAFEGRRTSYGLPLIALTAQSFLGGEASYMVPAIIETAISTP